MKILYVGHYNIGCTSRMRGEYLKRILKPKEFIVVDIDIPQNQTPALFRSFGWRFKKGPFINNVNNFLSEKIKGYTAFDLTWIDKGVFIKPDIIKQLKKSSNIIVHFTPDTAFNYNQSNLFYSALPLYDYCITTKSFEIDDYRINGAKQVILSTQGFDPHLHKKYHTFSKKNGVVFIGQNEEWREAVIASLIKENIQVKIAGVKWEKFVNRNKNNPNLKYYGKGLFGEAYAKLISGSFIGLGLLSKKFPEKHTTRTFEIPACGTALATENNDEIKSFYHEDEVLFFSDIKELTQKIKRCLANIDELEKLTCRAHKKVLTAGYDYEAILFRILNEVGFS